MDQNLSLYKVFYTVANTGNISKAAAELLSVSLPSANPSGSWSRVWMSLYFPETPGRTAYRRRGSPLRLCAESFLCPSDRRSPAKEDQ